MKRAGPGTSCRKALGRQVRRLEKQLDGEGVLDDELKARIELSCKGKGRARSTWFRGAAAARLVMGLGVAPRRGHGGSMEAIPSLHMGCDFAHVESFSW